ncbi:Scavenger receptor class A member 3 [Bienertia sinuspersici]
MMYEFDSLQSTNHTLALADNTEVKIVGILHDALIRVKNLFFLDDFYVIETKHDVVLESNGEKIELDMIDKGLIHEANATNYNANYLEQMGVDNFEITLNRMVADVGIEKLYTDALEEFGK